MNNEIQARILNDDGIFPNSSLPLIIYPDAIELDSHDPALSFEQLFRQNNWSNSWRNGLYSFHHYHSTAHEVLGVYSGWAYVQLGGESGIECEVKCHDVVVIPAGVAHKNIDCSLDFGVVGAYPDGTCPDLCAGKKAERQEACLNISNLALPSRDPVYGAKGPLFNHWHGGKR